MLNLKLGFDRSPDTAAHRTAKHSTSAQVCLVLATLALLAPLACKAWQIHDITDQMSGEITSYVYQQAAQTLNLGALAPEVKVYLNLSCDPEGGRYYVRTPNGGWGLDLYRSGSGATRSSYQDMRMRFDDGPVHETTWSVWDSSYASGKYEGASYTETAYTGRGPWWFTEQLRKAKRLRLELTFRGAGRHVVDFDLMGFSATSSQCGEGKWAHTIREQHLADKQRQKEYEASPAAIRDGSSEYLQAIQSSVIRNWRRPSRVPPGLKSIVWIKQARTGQVLRVTITEGSGNTAFDRSVEQAILAASPLPLPRNPKLFDPEIVLLFNPRS